jgi:hypothetical protein
MVCFLTLVTKSEMYLGLLLWEEFIVAFNFTDFSNDSLQLDTALAETVEALRLSKYGGALERRSVA